MNKFLAPAILLASSLAASAFGRATASAGTLTITTGASNDEFRVFVGPVAGQVTLEGVPNVVDGTTFNGISAINISTGLGNDKVYMVHEGVAMPAITVNTGAGEGLFDLDMRVPMWAAPLTSRIRYIGGAQKDEFFSRIESSASSLSLDWTSTGGEGQNETVVAAQANLSSFFGFRLNKTSGASGDRAQVDIEAASTRIVTDFIGSLGAGDDEFIANVKGSGASESFVTKNLTLGLGNDKSLVEVNEVGVSSMAGTVRGGDGSDILEARSGRSLSGSLIMDGGNGNDTLHLYTNGIILGSPRLLAGAGDDLVEMLGVRATGAPLSDGGLGFDYFKGIGRRINFEVIN